MQPRTPATRILVGLASAAMGLAANARCQNVQATLTAVQPILLQEWQLPATFIQQVAQPAGPLTSASLSLPPASASCALTPQASGWRLDAGALTYAISGYFSTSFDLRLDLDAPAGTIATLALDSELAGDGVSSVRLDIDDDGSDEVSTSWGSSFPRTTRRNFVIEFQGTPVPVRVRLTNNGFPGAANNLAISVNEWSSTATAAGLGCGGIGLVGGTMASTAQGVYDQVLELIDSPNPLSSGTLRARGIGNFATFLVATANAPTAITLPAPFSETCPALSGAIAAAGIANGAPLATSWDLALPLLPPGLTAYVQHATASWLPSAGGNVLFDTSNVLRVDI
ncbi:MAG: hypothetical protein AB8H80_20755 [Planctomycetota bacterium]